MDAPITPGQFRSQLDEAEALLRKYQLHQLRNHWVDYTTVNVGALRAATVEQRWKRMVHEQWFDLLLTDGSLLQFRPDLTPAGTIEELHYSYIQSPYKIPTYQRFVRDVLKLDYAEVGEAYWREYEDYSDQCDLRTAPMQVRFDYEPRLYNCGVHPAGHFHVGTETTVRLGASRVPGPTAFVLFVLRQGYPDLWPHVLKTTKKGRLQHWIRTALAAVPAKFRGDDDRAELWLE